MGEVIDSWKYLLAPLEFVVTVRRDTTFNPEALYGKFVNEAVEYSFDCTMGKVYGRKHPDGTFSVVGHFGARQSNPSQPRYFKPARFFPHKRENWRGVGRDARRRAIHEHGSLFHADTAKALLDWRHAERWFAGQSLFYTVTAVMNLDGRELASEIRNGIDSGAVGPAQMDVLGNQLVSKLRTGIPDVCLNMERCLANLRVAAASQVVLARGR